MKKLSIVVMAHPDRKAMAQELANSLGGVPIVWDKLNNVWDTCKRAWQAIDTTAEYGLVLQDDVLPCRDFQKRAEAVLKGRFVYNFFVHYGFSASVEKALYEGENHFTKGSIYGEIALCMPTTCINSMINYCDRHGAHSDTLISTWARSIHLRIRYPIPSLVDHRAGESLFEKYTGREPHIKEHHSCCFADNFDRMTTPKRTISPT
jgi:hypothetical protein